MAEKQTIPVKPYFLRAFYDWIVDNAWTPHILVDASGPDVQVPVDFVSDGQIVLNLKPDAVRNLELDNEGIAFHARFGGISQRVWVPTYTVLSIYAVENGQALTFPPEEAPVPEPVKKPVARPVSVKSVERSTEAEKGKGTKAPAKTAPKTAPKTAAKSSAKKASDADKEPPKPPKGKGPTLRLVKK